MYTLRKIIKNNSQKIAKKPINKSPKNTKNEKNTTTERKHN
jgi:hypothetical protein